MLGAVTCGRGWLFVALFCSLAPLSAGADPLDDVEKAASDWVKIRAETVRLESEWKTDRPLLETTAASLQERAATLEGQRDEARAETARDREELEASAAKNRALAEDLDATGARLEQLSAKLVQLRPDLPPRLSEALDLLYRSLARNDLSPGQRMQFVTTLLDRCAQFNRTVTCGEEALAIEGEPGERSYETIYWGLSHGYALDRKAGQAWLGTPGPQGWRWEAHPEAAAAVAKLIDVYDEREDPAFAALPVRLGHPAGTAGADESRP